MTLKICKSCSNHYEVLKDSHVDYCSKCVSKAKIIGCMTEIARRAHEEKRPIQFIINELLIYALDKQKEEAEMKKVIM